MGSDKLASYSIATFKSNCFTIIYARKSFSINFAQMSVNQFLQAMSLFKKSPLFFLLFSTLFAAAQQKDTVTVMTYNLLYYRHNFVLSNGTVICSPTGNNNTITKDNAMEDISITPCLIFCSAGNGRRQ